MLFTDKRFSQNSSDAKILYGLLFDRMSLPIKMDGMMKKTEYLYFKLE